MCIRDSYKSSKQEVDIVRNKTLEINFVLEQEVMMIDEVVTVSYTHLTLPTSDLV